MKSLWFTVLILAPAIAADSPTGTNDKDDRQALQGTWKVKLAERDGQKNQLLKRVVVAKDQITLVAEVSVKVGETEQLLVEESLHSFKLDASKKPKTIAFTAVGEQALGIYELDKDKLSICYAPRGKDRPTQFTTKAGSGHTLMVLERQKP